MNATSSCTWTRYLCLTLSAVESKDTCLLIALTELAGDCRTIDRGAGVSVADGEWPRMEAQACWAIRRLWAERSDPCLVKSSKDVVLLTGLRW